MNVNEINVLVLAYLGDTIYEDYIRKHLILKGIGNVNDLQNESLKYVSAKGQAKYINDMLDNSFFSDMELSIIKRARNNSSKTHPKNCDVVTYRYATALETLIGYLELSNNKERINEIMNYILGE